MRREEQRVLAGSLNLLTPSDKTPENDALELLNFRVDQAGVLRGGDTFARLPNAYFGAAVHTIFPLGDLGTRSYPGWGNPIHVQFPALTFLVGAAGNLYLYMNSQVALLASGFDGQPLGITIFNGFIWVMNRAKQVKLNPLAMLGFGGQSVGSWLPAAPATACTATARTGTSGGGLSGTYSYFVTYVRYIDNIAAESAAGPGAIATAADGVISITGLPLPSEDLGSQGEIRVYRSGGTLAQAYLLKTFRYVDVAEGAYPSLQAPFIDTVNDSTLAAGGVPIPTTSATTVYGTVLLNGWTSHVGDYEGGVNQGHSWQLGAAGAYTNADQVGPGTTTKASIVRQGTHQYDGCVWDFAGSGFITSGSLAILSEVPANGEDGLTITLRSAGIWYSLDGGSNWTQVYNQGPRAQQWDTISLPDGQDVSQIQVMAFQDAHDDMAQYVYTIQISGVITAGAPAAPAGVCSVAGGLLLNAATQPVGTYQYYVTFVSDAGLETNPGPASNPVTSVEGIIDVSAIPVSSDPTVTGRRIYRTGGTLGQAYQVANIADNTTTAYVDTQSDLALTETSIAMPTTNDGPPSALGLVGPYFNRLLAFDGNRLWWTQEGVPTFYGSQPGSAIGNWVDVGAADDHIQAITQHSRIAILYKQRSVWRLQGDPDTGILEQTSAAIGALGPRAVTPAGAVDYVLSTDGCFLFDLDSEHKRSENLDTIFYGVVNWTGLGAADIPRQTWVPTRPVCGWLNGTLLISDGANSAFVMHAETERWAPVRSNFGNGITAIATVASAVTYYVGDTQGYLMRSQQVQAPGGVQPVSIWQTRFLHQGLGDEPKYYQNLVLDAELNGATAKIYCLFDSAGTGSLSAAFQAGISGTARQKFYVPLPDDLAAKHISVRVEVTTELGATTQFAIHGLYVYYEVEARDAAVVRMRAIDFRSELVKIARKLTLDVNGACALAIYTDEPGPMSRAAFLKSIDTGGKRQVVKVGLPPNLRGRLWRATVTTSSGETTRLYSMRVWMRSVGTAGTGNWDWAEWLTGAPAETPNAT